MNSIKPFQQNASRRNAGFIAFPERGAAANPLVWLTVLFAIGVVMPFVPVPSRVAVFIGTIVITVVYVVAVMQLIVQFTRLQWPPAKTALLFFGCIALWALTDFFIIPGMGAGLSKAARAAHGLPPTSLPLPFVVVNALHNLALLGAASLGGALLSRLITDANMVAPICFLIALIDIWGVLFSGIVAQLLEKAPNVSRHAMTSLPSAGIATHSAFKIPLPDVGAGDYLFLGLLFAALHAHRMNWQGAARWVTPLICGALLGVAFGVPALPGLLFIGLGVAIPNLKFFKFTRDEKFALIWAGVFVGVLTVGFYFAAPFIVGAAQNLEPTNRAAK